MKLPPEVISLIHHIELTEAHWWEKALQRFLIAAIADHGPLAKFELPAIVRREYSVEVSSDQVDAYVEDLILAGDVIQLPDTRVKLSETATSQVAGDRATAAEQQQRLEERFLECLVAHDVDIDPRQAWADFEEQFLTPLVRELGARTYELLVAHDPEGDVPSLQELIGKAGSLHGAEFRRAVVRFLDPNDTDVRAYVLRTLNAHFFVQASSLPPEVLDAIQSARERRTELRVILDTNFVFSVLRLHDNPANEVAEALAALISKVQDRVAVALYVLPVTIEEARRVLGAHIDHLSGLRPPQSLARAAVARTEFSGLAQRYFVAAATSPTVVTPEDFFGPYESNMLDVLREHGVDVFNEDMDPYHEDQEIIDDVVEEERYQREKQLRRQRRPKSYNTVLHDMILWHFVHRKRPVAADSPLDLIFWAVTEDFGLISFDRYRRRSASSFPMFLTPAALMQLLQFWVPRSEELDRALIAALRLPFLFQDFDKSAEQVTTRILRALSRYENVGDLSVSVATGVLANKALRSRLSEPGEAVQEDVALRDAVIEEAARVERERALLAEQLREVNEETERQRIAAEEERIRAQASERILKDDLDKAKEQQREELASMQEEVSRVRDHEDELADEVGRLQTKLTQQASIRRFIAFGVALIVPLTAIGWLIYIALDWLGLQTWICVATAVTLSLGGWMALAPLLGRDRYVRETRLGRLLTWSGSGLLRLVSVLAIGVVSGLLVELISAP